MVFATTHTAKDGSPKIVPECTFPLTAQRAVDVVVTDAATFRTGPAGLVLVDLAAGTTVDRVREHTAAPFRVELADSLLPQAGH